MMPKKLYLLPQDDLHNIVIRAKDDLIALSGGHIFLTGCTSFFGKWLTEALLYANEHLTLNLNLTVLSRAPERFFNSAPHFKTHSALTALTGDILTADIDTITFTHAIHGANLPFDGTQDWPVRHMDTAVLGTKRLVEASAKNGCKSILYLSSGAAYRAEASSGAEASISQVLREAQGDKSDNISEASVYSITKRFTEAYATGLGEAHGVRIPLARAFSFAGPYMPLDTTQALGNFLANALAGKDIVIKGDGAPMRSYMYGADLVVWLLALLARGRHGVPYNVGSREAVSILETAQTVSRAFPEKKLQVLVLGKLARGNAPSIYVPDTDRCEQELGLTCSATLEAICARTIKWNIKQKAFSAFFKSSIAN